MGQCSDPYNSGRTPSDSMTLERSGQPGEADLDSSARPAIFLLPGLSGEALDVFWEPARSALDLVPVSYLDWTDLIEAGCDGRALARHVLRQIENRMPAGLIRMAGYSIGGHLAYSAAMELQAQGRIVSSVVILDATVHLGAVPQSFRVRMRERMESLLPFNFRAGLASILAKLLVREACRPLLHRFSGYRHVPLPFHFERYLHNKITMQLVRRIHPAWWQTLLRQSPSLEAPAYLFRSEDHRPEEGEDLGWAGLCRNLKVIAVVGTHGSMLEPPNDARLRIALIDALLAESG